MAEDILPFYVVMSQKATVSIFIVTKYEISMHAYCAQLTTGCWLIVSLPVRL
jgi:hypothetical protein